MASVGDSPEWKALGEHHAQIRDAHLRDLFADDASRGTTFVVELGDLYLDYSKNRITAETVQLLVELAEAAGLRDRIEAMFCGEHINVTEDRAVLHVALRAPRDERLVVDDQEARCRRSEATGIRRVRDDELRAGIVQSVPNRVVAVQH